MRSAAKLNYAQAQARHRRLARRHHRPAARHRMLEPLYAAYRALKRARDERGPLDLDLPERKIVLTAHGTVDRVITPERLDAHRLIEEFMILANVAAAETLERARVPLIYRVHDEPDRRSGSKRCASSCKTLDISLPKGGALRAEQFNRILAAGEGPRGREAGQRGGAAHPGAGRICRRELRAFRPQPAPLRAFHLADPPLCRPDRASRPDPRAEARRRRPARDRRHAQRSARSPPRFRPPSAAP